MEVNGFMVISGIGGFNIELAKAKTFEEFYEHEKHLGFSKEKMAEIYEATTGKKAGKASLKPAAEKTVE